MPSKPKSPSPPNYNPDLKMIVVIIILVGAGVIVAFTYEAIFGG